MRNPEIWFWRQARTAAEGPPSQTVYEARPVYFRNDFLGRHVLTVNSPFLRGAPVDPEYQNVVDGFCKLWWSTLAEQGFFEKAKELAARQEHDAYLDLDNEPDLDP
jgi:hypothetical protein